MIFRKPTREEYENQSNSLIHFSKKGLVFKDGLEGFKECAKEIGFDKKYPFAYDAVFLPVDELVKKYPEEVEYVTSSACNHRRQGRLPSIWAKDLCANWIIEDYIMYKIEHLGFQICNNGADKSRRLKVDTVTNDADFLIRRNDDEEWNSIELSITYIPLVKNRHYFHLRDDKYPNLREKQSLLLHLEPPSRKFVLFIPGIYEDGIKATYKNRIECWSREDHDVPGYKIDILDINNILPFEDMSHKINDVLDKMNQYRNISKNEYEQDDINTFTFA